MVRKISHTLVAIMLVTTTSWAQTDSPVQSSARPMGLDIAAPVQLGGSDEKSAQFAGEVLPDLRSWVNQNLGERTMIQDPSRIALDPQELFLSTASEVRVYFVSEGAGYHNTLGFSDGEMASLILPDASSRDGNYQFDYDSEGEIIPSSDGWRTSSEPVVPGDFVELGTLDGGTRLDFFLIGNGARGGQHTYSTELEDNPDGIVHTVAFSLPDSPYLLIGFEDLYGGGDRDYNDLVFAVDIGKENVRALGGPEPGTTVLIISMLAWARRRRERHVS